MREFVNSAAKKEIPNFSVEWQKSSESFEDYIRYAPADVFVAGDTRNESRHKLATLQTDSVYIEVSQANFPETVNFTVTPDRVGLCLVTSVSDAAVTDYSYRHMAHHETVCFMVPGKKISAVFLPGTFRTVICSFEPSLAEHVLGQFENISGPAVTRSLNTRSPVTNFMLLRLMKEALFPGPVSSVVAESMANALLAECAHMLTCADSLPQYREKLTGRHREIIRDYVSGLSGRQPSVSEIAQACGFSERHFAKLFKQDQGCAISHYIKSVRIARAKAYLLETDLQLKEIAYQLGFSSLSNFSFAFREATGISPSKFRRNHAEMDLRHR